MYSDFNDRNSTFACMHFLGIEHEIPLTQRLAILVNGVF